MNSDNIFEEIFTLMQNDDDAINQSEELESIYDDTSELEKKVIDKILICICGYSLDTITNHPEDISYGDGE